jgi:hypothetical protein
MFVVAAGSAGEGGKLNTVNIYAQQPGRGELPHLPSTWRGPPNKEQKECVRLQSTRERV